MLSLSFGQAKYYVDSLSQNIKRGLNNKAKRGEVVCGRTLPAILTTV